MGLLKEKIRHLQVSNFGNILRGSSKAFLFSISGRGLKLLYTFYIARELGIKATGVYFLCFSIVTLGAMLSKLGLNNYVIKYINIGYQRGDWRDVLSKYHISIILTIVVSGLLILAISLSEQLIDTYILPNMEVAGILGFFSLAVLPVNILHLNSEAIKAIEKPGWSSFVNFNIQPLTAIPLLYILIPMYGLWGAVLAFHISIATALLFSLGVWIYFVDGYKLYIEKDAIGVLKFAFPHLLIVSLNFIMTYTDTLSLGILSTEEQLGGYEISWRVATILTYVLLAFSTVLAPKFAGLYNSGKLKEIEIIAQRSSLVITLLVLPIALVFIFLSDPLIPYFFGADYEVSIAPLQILTIAQFINVFTGPVGYILMMCGYEIQLRNIIAVSSLLNIVLNIALIPHWGGVGAAIATGISLIILNITSLIVVNKKMGIVPIPLNLRKVLGLDGN